MGGLPVVAASVSRGTWCGRRPVCGSALAQNTTVARSVHNPATRVTDAGTRHPRPKCSVVLGETCSPLGIRLPGSRRRTCNRSARRTGPKEGCVSTEGAVGTELTVERHQPAGRSILPAASGDPLARLPRHPFVQRPSDAVPSDQDAQTNALLLLFSTHASRGSAAVGLIGRKRILVGVALVRSLTDGRRV